MHRNSVPDEWKVFCVSEESTLLSPRKKGSHNWSHATESHPVAVYGFGQLVNLLRADFSITCQDFLCNASQKAVHGIQVKTLHFQKILVFCALCEFSSVAHVLSSDCVLISLPKIAIFNLDLCV